MAGRAERAATSSVLTDKVCQQVGSVHRAPRGLVAPPPFPLCLPGKCARPFLGPTRPTRPFFRASLFCSFAERPVSDNIVCSHIHHRPDRVLSHWEQGHRRLNLSSVWSWQRHFHTHTHTQALQIHLCIFLF